MISSSIASKDNFGEFTCSECDCSLNGHYNLWTKRIVTTPPILPPSRPQVTPSQLTVQALTVIQELVALLSNHNEQYWQLMRHLLFNFHIWSCPDFSVRIGHTNYILTVVRDNLKECRAEFGVHYFLDVIRIFYRFD